MKSNEANRDARQVVGVVYLLALAVTLGACGGPTSTEVSEEVKETIVEGLNSTDVSEELKETIVQEAFGEMDPIIADAVNEAVEDC